MFLITKRLREHLEEKCGLKPGESEADVRKFVAEKIAAGELELDTVSDLTKQSDAEIKVKGMIDEAIDPINSKVDGVVDSVGKLTDMFSKQFAGGDGASTQEPEPKTEPTTAKDGGSGVQAKEGDGVSTAQKAMGSAAMTMPEGEGGSGDGSQVRVKSPFEQFDDTRTAALWSKSAKIDNFRAAMGDQQLSMQGEAAMGLDMPTQRSKAITGVWFKLMVGNAFREAGRPCPQIFTLKTHEREWVKSAINECSFVGPLNVDTNDESWDRAGDWMAGETFKQKGLDAEYWTKALLDGTVSGGQYIVPIEFDANVILTPLLTGELFPRVNVVNVTRRRIESAAISNWSLSWGTAEGSAITPYTTTDFVSQFNHNVYPVVGAMDMGKDFLSDSPIDIGGIIQTKGGEAFRKALDDVIATGNGTNRPEGVKTASSTTSVSSTNGATGPPTVSDYEGLMLGIAKELLQEAGPRFAFVGTQTSYQRAKGIQVDSTNDQRRVFNMEARGSNLRNFMLLDADYAVNSGMGNGTVMGVCFNRYRMYRRLGLEVRLVDEGRTNVLSNQQTLVLRARFGGALELAAAATKSTDMQS